MSPLAVGHASAQAHTPCKVKAPHGIFGDLYFLRWETCVYASAPVGAYKAVAVAPSPFDADPYLSYERFIRMGVSLRTFDRLRQFNIATAMAQYYGNVQEGMVYADEVHLYRGLERPLMHEDNADGDKDVYVYSWIPRWDWEWNAQTQQPVRRHPPSDRVFAVQTRIFAAPDKDGMVGEVLHWTWIAEDPALKGAPLEADERYAEQIWKKVKR